MAGETIPPPTSEDMKIDLIGEWEYRDLIEGEDSALFRPQFILGLIRRCHAAETERNALKAELKTCRAAYETEKRCAKQMAAERDTAAVEMREQAAKKIEAMQFDSATFEEAAAAIRAIPLAADKGEGQP